MSDSCPDCGTHMAETGAPIWEVYCPNTDCDHELRQMRESIKIIQERRERERLAELKAKYE